MFLGPFRCYHLLLLVPRCCIAPLSSATNCFSLCSRIGPHTTHTTPPPSLPSGLLLFLRAAELQEPFRTKIKETKKNLTGPTPTEDSLFTSPYLLHERQQDHARPFASTISFTRIEPPFDDILSSLLQTRYPFAKPNRPCPRNRYFSPTSIASGQSLGNLETRIACQEPLIAHTSPSPYSYSAEQPSGPVSYASSKSAPDCRPCLAPSCSSFFLPFFSFADCYLLVPAFCLFLSYVSSTVALALLKRSASDLSQISLFCPLVLFSLSFPPPSSFSLSPSPLSPLFFCNTPPTPASSPPLPPLPRSRDRPSRS